MIQAAPLFITSDMMTRLHALRDNATFRSVDITTLAERIKTPHGKAAHMRHMSEQSLIIPGVFPFMVTYSIETGHPCGTCRHMSVSIQRKDRVPNEAAVWIIAQELGFTDSLEACDGWIETLMQGPSVNVIQPMSESEADGIGISWSGASEP